MFKGNLVLGTLAGGLMLAAPELAQQPQSTSVFELDGNAMASGSASSEDWQTLNAGGGTASAFTGIIADPGQNTIFAGGPKDIQDVSTWAWKGNGGFPDKNDITDAFAAAYMLSGDLVVYFGADRYSNSGDAYLGFWFFKDRVTMNPNGTFSGQHQVGDLLILVNYPQGATAIPEVEVLEWNPALQDLAENLHLLYQGPGARCGAVPPATACAITNTDRQLAPWPYKPKVGTLNAFPAQSFFEGGINLTQVLGGTKCFSSFLAETRSATSVTATLKDFVLAEFPVCDISVSKSCDVVRFTPDFSSFVVGFAATVTNTGAGTFPPGSLVTINDDAGTPGNTADDVILTNVLGVPLAPRQQLTLSGQFQSAQNPPFNTVTASIATQETTVKAVPFSVQCNSLSLNPGLALSKMCTPALESAAGMLTLRVDFTGDVQNTGNVPLYVTVVDEMAGTVLPERLINPGQTVKLSGFYYPVQANGGVTDPTTAMFSDSFTATGRNPILSKPVVEVVTSNCGLCR